MNRLFTVVLASLLSLVPTLSTRAASVDCVPDKGCPKGAKPGSCCTLPKCEFLYALMMARAEVSAYSGDFLAALGGTRTNLQQINQDLRTTMKQARAKNRRCPTNDFYIEPPTLFVSPTAQCAITASVTGKSRTISFDEFDLHSNSCKEIVQAEWEQALQEQFYCNRPYQPDPEVDLDSYRKRQQAAARAKLRSLEDSLRNYRSACTKVTDAKMARHVSRLGLQALKDDAKQKPPKKTKRAKGKRR